MIRDSKRDRRSDKAARIAASVEAFVMMQHPVRLVVELGRREDRAAGCHVNLELRSLPCGQRVELPEDRIGDPDLADVVEETGEADALQPVA